MNKKLIDLLRKNFKERLQLKTSWGRNDLLAEFELAINDTILELMDDSK
ncbi:MAG: hypothetical protein PHC28_13480 [Flavobacterium sp.]|nr:hypothetical protein [Flavobacterium sp.]MDD5151464.1 hypothetical protein [Flavobacterium sp.]